MKPEQSTKMTSLSAGAPLPKCAGARCPNWVWNEEGAPMSEFCWVCANATQEVANAE